MFFNLISNAFRYTPQGGSITIKAALRDNEYVHISVEDTGRGIPVAEQQKVFGKFMQSRGEHRGTGLGLYIVKKIMEAHGSITDLRSEPGKGTAFLFTLKKGNTPVPVKSEPVPLLIIGLGESIVNLINEALGNDRFAVHKVQEVRQALDMIPSLRPEVIIVYQSIQCLDIEKFLDLLKNDPSACHIPVIVVSANYLNDWEEKCSALIPLPLNQEILKAALSKILK